MDELEFDGARYIAAKRAAREHGYTSDYLGQLIRGGKLTGRKVGRAWYVEESSLKAYLSGAEGKSEAAVPERAVPVAPAISINETPKEAPAVHIPVRVVEEKKVPLASVEKEIRATPKDYALLTYLSDEDPVMPSLHQPHAEEARVAVKESVLNESQVVEASVVPETPPEFYDKLITEDIPKRHRGQHRELLPAPAALMAGLALALLLTVGSVTVISEKLTYEGGVLSSSYALEYRGVDIAETVAGVILSASSLRISE